MSGRDIRDTVGLAAVVAGLVFVGMEIQQNTDAVQSATVQALSEQSFSAVALLIENEGLRTAFYDVLEDPDTPLSTNQRRQVDAYYDAVMRIQQNRFYQARLEILDLEILLGLGGRTSIYRMPYFADYWERSRSNFPDDFAAYIEDQFEVTR